jgi:hypothetical protein
MNLKT